MSTLKIYKHLLPILSIVWCALAILDSITGNYLELSFIRGGWASMTVVTSSLFILLFGAQYFPSTKLRKSAYLLLVALGLLDIVAGFIWDDRTFISSFSTALFHALMGVYGYLYENNIRRNLTYYIKIGVYYFSSIVIILYFYDPGNVYKIPGFETMSWNTAAGFMLYSATRIPMHFEHLIDNLNLSRNFKFLSKNVLEAWLYASFIVPIFIIIAITTFHFLDYISSDTSISIILFFMIVLPFPLTTFLFKDAVKWNKIISQKDAVISASEEELVYFNKLLTEFAQITSHNLRGPVVSMKNLIDVASDKEAPDFVKDKSLVLLRDKINAYKYTIDNLNQFYKMIHQKEIEYAQCELENILYLALNSAKEDDPISLSDYQLIINFEAPTLHYPVIYVENVFYNLCSNAIKYAKKDEKLIIEVSSSFIDADTIEIRFKDNGLGMDLTYFGDKIFQFGRSYHNFDNSRGVGLFIVKSQLNRNGDDITVRSEEGVYTEFIITIKNQDAEKLVHN